MVFDTSIWLDFFENRNEPNMPKGEWANTLLRKIIKANHVIIYSDIVLLELYSVGYQVNEVDNLFKKIRPVALFIESTEKQIRKAKDLVIKRRIPKGDALHALIARDNGAILVTLDKHFQGLRDIVKLRRPQDF